MVCLSGKVDAFDRLRECLTPDSPEERCSLDVIEAAIKQLDLENVRSDCTLAEQAEIDDLWRLLKMIYNGATRQEALAARKSEHIQDGAVAQAYGKALCYLNPKSPDAKTCSIDDLEATCTVLDAKEAHSGFSQAQNQVIDQLRKAIQDVKTGDSVQTAIQHVWEDRNNSAQRRLMDASTNFIGVYPSGGADAFAKALECLSPDSPEERCSLKTMESTFRSLDLELVRLECSEAQIDVIDDLWRLIKMMYNGATRQEALAARRPDEMKDDIVARQYAKVLRFLNPASSEGKECSLEDLEASFHALNIAAVRATFTNAQHQVLEQLEKVIQVARGGDSVHASIRKVWKDRDDAARINL